LARDSCWPAPQRAHKKLVQGKARNSRKDGAQRARLSEHGQTGGLPVATSPIADELSALEQARSGLEAALASDENWRALTQPGREDDTAGASAARQTRNTRLEMALAGNAHYQAWKHVNGAIDALRARSVAQSQAAEPLVRPDPAGKTTRGATDLPDDIAALLREETLDATPDGVPRIEQPEAPAGPLPSARAGLVQRLGRLEEGTPAAAAGPAAGPAGIGGSAKGQGPARPPERKAHPIPADPPEATVTFVVRESRAPLLPSAGQPPELGTGRNSAMFDRAGSLDEEPAPPGETYSLSKDESGEEAEVTILTAEGLRQRREAEERDNIVRRFRKALSGD
jgi:hypothetical protein